MKKFLMIIVAACCLVSVSAQTSKYEADARKIVDLQNNMNDYKVMMPAILQSIKVSYPTVPDSFWGEMQTTLSSDAEMDTLKESLVKVYTQFLSENFTLDEVEQVLAFYSSPIGQKMWKADTQMAQESLEVGEKWGHIIGRRVVTNIALKGYIK